MRFLPFIAGTLALIVAGAAQADITNLNIVYNLRLHSAMNHYKEDARLAVNLIEAAAQTGEDVSGKVAEIIQQGLERTADMLEFEKVDTDVIFKSILGTQGRKSMLVAGQKVYWVRKDNFKLKPYLLEAVKVMRKKLVVQANGNASGKFNRHFEDLAALEVLTASIEAEADVKRNRKAEELDRKPRPAPAPTQDPAPGTDEPPAVTPAQ